KALLRDPIDLVNGAKAPEESRATAKVGVSRNGATREMPAGDTYTNAPLVNFVYRESREKMKAALNLVRQTLGRKYPLTIGGEKVWTGRTIASINPTKPDQVIGYQSEAGIAESERAVAAAKKAFDKWSRTPIERRARILERCAA